MHNLARDLKDCILSKDVSFSEVKVVTESLHSSLQLHDPRSAALTLQSLVSLLPRCGL